jgi:hypothetical protein
MAPALSDGTMSRSTRSEKSVEWMRENVSGVRSLFFLPREVVDLTMGDEFHSLKRTG